MSKKTMNFNSWNWESENWGGDPEGPLAKALEKAREKNEERKPLKIERLPKKQDSLEMISCPYCEEFGGGEVPTNFDYDSGDMWSPATLEITEWEMCEYCEGEGKVEDNEEYQKIPKWDWSYLEPDEPEYDRYYDAEATNIDWETDGQEVDLPKKVKVPDDLDADEIADYLSDEYDFLVNSFQIKDAESFEAPIVGLGPVTAECSSCGLVDFINCRECIICQPCLHDGKCSCEINEAESFEADMTKQGKDFVSKKIATIMRDWKKTGKIGNSTPKNAKAAQQQAIAVAFSMAARKGFKGTKRAEDEGYYMDSVAKEHGFISNKLLLGSLAVILSMATISNMMVKTVVSAKDLRAEDSEEDCGCGCKGKGGCN